MMIDTFLEEFSREAMIKYNKLIKEDAFDIAEPYDNHSIQLSFTTGKSCRLWYDGRLVCKNL